MVLSYVITVRVPPSSALVRDLLIYPLEVNSSRVSFVACFVQVDGGRVSKRELSPSSGGSSFTSYLCLVM